MIDVNAEIEKSLEKVDCEAVYYYPNDFSKLPVISFYQLTERPAFAADNAEQIQRGTAVVDIWTDAPSDGGKIAVEVNDAMASDGWEREFSMDVKPDENFVFHKTMRFSKIFNL